MHDSLWWLGAPELGHRMAPLLSDAVPSIVVIDAPPWIREPAPAPAAVVDATALDAERDVIESSAAIDALLDRAQPPSRIVHVVGLQWLGRAARASDAGRAAYVVAHARANALRHAPRDTTVNVVVVPDGFPDAPPRSSAPVSQPIGVDDLAHALRYFLDPGNGYVLGQVVSICGGDDAWGNHSL